MTDDREAIEELYREYWRCMIKKEVKGLRRMMIREKRAAPHSSSNPPSACAASAIGSTFLRRMFAIRIQV